MNEDKRGSNLGEDVSSERRRYVPPRERDAKSRGKKGKKRGFFGNLFLFLLSVVLLVSALVCVVGALFVLEISKDLPTEEEILSYRANEASLVYDRNGNLIAELYLENRRPVKLQDVSPWLTMSVLAAEDSDFYSHKGVRPLAIVRSLASGEGGGGASTITQQLARNLFLTTEKTLVRKGKEIILSMQLEKLYSKDALLETYLNAIYFGHGAWGVDAAARTYFDKSAKDLSLAESSVLAGLIAAPERYSPIKNPELSKRRQNYVLGRMQFLGWASKEEADAAAGVNLKMNERTLKNQLIVNKAPYFVSHILFKELIPMYGADRVYKSGMRIYTTLDLELQQAADRALQKLKSEGAVIAVDPETGEVLALAGGKSFDETKFNRATQAYRQPGSAFKPVVYASAIESGYLPNDLIMDAPVAFMIPTSDDANPDYWAPKNYSPTFAGKETLITAMDRSHNTPVVRLTYMVGIREVMDMGRRLGITSPYMRRALSIGLGTASVTPMEMASVFSAFGNGGKRVAPYYVREIRNDAGEVILSNFPQKEDAISLETATIVRSMMEDVVRAGTGARARIQGYETFGKTGTTNNYSDAWFAGGIPGLVTIVYAGNDDNTPLGSNSTGSVVALPIWKDFMDQAVKIRSYDKVFPPIAEGLTRTNLCRVSGYLAVRGCSSVPMVMPSGKVPNETCPVHGGGGVSAGSEMLTSFNAPRLILLPQDQEEMLLVDSVVAEAISSGDVDPRVDEQIGSEFSGVQTSEEGRVMSNFEGTGRTPTRLPVRNVQPGRSNNRAAPPPPEPVKEKTFDEKYEDLLKKYKIKE